MFIKLALRNLLRNRRRTIITQIGIVTGVVVIIFVGGLLQNMSGQWADSLITRSLGHIQIINKEYREKLTSNPLHLTMTDADSIPQILAAIPEIEAFTPQLSFGGLIGKDDRSTTFFGTGIVPEKIKRVLPAIDKMLVEGRLPESGEVITGVVGQGLAKNLGIKTGDILLLVSNTISGQMNAVDLEVTGIVKTGEEVVDQSMVITTLANVQMLLDMEGRYSEYLIRLKNPKRLSPTIKILQSKLDAKKSRLKAYSWYELSGEFASVNGMFDGLSTIIGLIILFLVGIGIVNTMTMSVFERTKEIGTIMAIGTQRRQVMYIFILEGLMTGLVGAIIGVVIGSVITIICGNIGIPLPPPPGQTTKLVLYPVLSAKYIISAIFLSVIVSTAASFYPARLASRLNPAEIFSRH